MRDCKGNKKRKETGEASGGARRTSEDICKHVMKKIITFYGKFSNFSHVQNLEDNTFRVKAIILD